MMWKLHHAKCYSKYDATPFGPNNGNIKLFRVIGTVDIDGQGTELEITQVPFSIP